MFKELLADSGYGLLGQIALVIFFIVFVAIVIRTLLRPQNKIDRYSRMPLNDHDVQDDRDAHATDNDNGGSRHGS